MLPFAGRAAVTLCGKRAYEIQNILQSPCTCVGESPLSVVPIMRLGPHRCAWTATRRQTTYRTRRRTWGRCAASWQLSAGRSLRGHGDWCGQSSRRASCPPAHPSSWKVCNSRPLRFRVYNPRSSNPRNCRAQRAKNNGGIAARLQWCTESSVFRLTP